MLRQRERDLQFAWQMVQQLPERAYELLLVLQAVARRHRQGSIPPLVDTEVAEAAATLASTLETASRGIIFEHQASSLSAQRLVRELREALASFERDGGPGFERDAALALRRLERAGREARSGLADSDTALLDFFDRAARPGDAEEQAGAGREAVRRHDPEPREAVEPRIILP